MQRYGLGVVIVLWTLLGGVLAAAQQPRDCAAKAQRSERPLGSPFSQTLLVQPDHRSCWREMRSIMIVPALRVAR